MKLIKTMILIGFVWTFFGVLIAFPANVFALVILFVGYLAVALTFGSADYWRRYADHVSRPDPNNDRTDVQ
jgi:hypothetical protein